MNTTPPWRRATLAGLVLIAACAGIAALDKGATVFSKRNQTNLLAEPKPLAAAAGKVGFAESLKIEEVRGSWLRVKAAKAAGWVFNGNIAEEKPSLPPAAGLTTVSASETDTVAAARPLTPAANGFAERHNAADARADVEWLDQAADDVKGADVETYLRDNKKGEYKL